MPEDWFSANAPNAKADQDWFAQNAAADTANTKSILEAQAKKFPTSAELGGKPGSVAPTPMYEGVVGFLAKLGHAMGMPGSGPLEVSVNGKVVPVDTGNASTSIPGLDIARGAFEGGIPGAPELSLQSGAKALVKASPAGQTVQAAGDLAKSGNQAVNNAFKEFMDRPREPVAAMTKALKPISTNIQFGAHVERALPELKAAEAQLGKPIEGVQDLADAIKVAKKNIWGQYQQIAGPQAARGVDASPVADAIERSIPLKLKVQDPGAVERIKALADTYRRTFTLGELDDMLSTSNAELLGYYAKYPAAQRVAAAGNPDTAQNVAEAGALRKLIYDQLDSTAGAQELKQTYGSLTNLEKETQRRLNVAARQNPDSLSEQLSRWQAAMKVGKAVTTFPGRPLGALGDVASAYAGRTAATALKEANSSDALIANVFRNYDGPLPARIAAPPFQPKALIGPGAIPLPAIPDTSGPIPFNPPLAIHTRVPDQLNYESFGQALKTAHTEAVMGDMVKARLAQFKDVARSGYSEVTGKGLRDMNEATGELSAVLHRGGGGFKNMFPELKGFPESPSEIAEAIEKGSGPLFTRIEKAVRQSLPELAAQPSDLDFAFGANVSPVRASAWDAVRKRLNLPR